MRRPIAAMRAHNTTKLAVAIIGLVFLLACVRRVDAVSIPILNPSFEAPAVPGSYAVTVPDNWLASAGLTDTFVEDSASVGFTGGDGAQYAGMDTGGGYIYQNLGVPFTANTTYTINLASAHRVGFSHGTVEFGLFSSNAIGTNVGTPGFMNIQGVWSGSGNPDADDQFNQLRDASVLHAIGSGALGNVYKYTTGAVAPTGNLAVFVRDASGGRVNFDNIRLAANASDFIDFSLRAADNSLLLPGRLYVPPEATSSAPRPLILFLHGAGESGTDNLAQINGNIDNLLAETKLRGAYLYAPQTNSGWANSTVLTQTMTMINQAIAEQQVDRSRIYITGLSMGGGGVGNMLTKYPARFAAAVPIAPVTPSPLRPAQLLGQPMWDFHARDDATVAVSSSRIVINTIIQGAGQPALTFPPLNSTTDFQYDNQLLDLHYTEFAIGGHGIWPMVYQRQDMYDWMFAHTLVPEPSALLLLATASFATLATRRRKRPSRIDRMKH
jgi:predicted esterase